MFRGSGYAWNKNFVWTGGYEVAVAKPTVAASAGSATDAAIVVAKHGGGASHRAVFRTLGSCARSPSATSPTAIMEVRKSHIHASPVAHTM